MRRGRAWFILSFLTPAAVLYGLFVLWPLGQTLAFSLFDSKTGMGASNFVGVANYQSVLKDDAYRQTLQNTFIMLLVLIPGLTALSLLLAHAIEGDGLVARFARAVYLAPHMAAVVATAVIWMFLLNPSIGMFRGAGPTNGWLGTPQTALGAVTLAMVWYALGFYVMLYSAGLRQIDQEVRESAKLDGASGWIAFQKISWPLLWSIRKTAIPYIVINVFGIFALVMIMTGGGNPDRATEAPLTLLYEVAFAGRSDFSKGVTMGALNFGIAMALSLGILWLHRKRPDAARA